MDPATAAIAATVISAGSSIYSGFEARRADLEAAKAAEYRAGIARLGATQQAARGAQDMNQALGAIQALRAGRGLSAGSPTAAAIMGGTRRRAADATNTAVLNQLIGMDAQRNQASQLRRGANNHVIKGFANAATSALGSESLMGALGGGG